jgi:hypothetical protein
VTTRRTIRPDLPSPDLPGSDLARQLLAHLPTDRTRGFLPVPDGSGRLDVITLVAYRRGRGDRLTGEVIVAAWLPEPGYGFMAQFHRRPGWTSPPIASRLRPGWTEAQFLRAAEGVYARALVAARLQLLQENVADAFKPYEGDAVAQAEFRARKGCPHPWRYRDMTAEDCAFWLKWITTWGAHRRDADAVTT